MKVNFAAVKTSYPNREAGLYPGTLIGYKFGTSGAGQPTLSLQWSEDDSPNRMMFGNYSLQPQALWKLKRDLLRIGADVEEMNSEDTDLEEIVKTLIGYQATLEYGDPRPDQKDPDKLYDNFLGIAAKD